jgi:hypothetical protein
MKPVKHIIEDDVQVGAGRVIWEGVLDHVWEQALSSVYRPLDTKVKRRVMDVTWAEVDRHCLRKRSRKTR